MNETPTRKSLATFCNDRILKSWTMAKPPAGIPAIGAANQHNKFPRSARVSGEHGTCVSLGRTSQIHKEGGYRSDRKKNGRRLGLRPISRITAFNNSGSIDKVQSHAFVSVEESYKGMKVGRVDIIVNGAEIPMIGNVEHISPEPEVMRFPALRFQDGYSKDAIGLEVQ